MSLSLAFAVAGIAILLTLIGLSARQTKITSAERIIVDGSNVMFWDNGQPSLQTVAKVVAELQRRGFAPHVYFDANVGYKVSGRHMDEVAIAKAVKLPVPQVCIVTGGEPADPHLLNDAQTLGARVVSNDRFSEWRRAYPHVRRKGVLVKGQANSGKVVLRMLPLAG